MDDGSVGGESGPHDLCVLGWSLASIGPAAVARPGDVTKLASLPELVSTAERLAGPISILINNAGVHLEKPALDTTDDEFVAVLQTHLCGAFALTREVGRRMVERRRGSVIFMASMVSLMGMPRVVAYSAAKSAYIGVVRTLATEWGADGVCVNAIAPGWIGSPMREQALQDDPARRAKILGRIPTGGFGEPHDIGWAAVYLSSPAASYVNGVVLPIDGGAAESF
ncbi:MAG: SDR family oxidoreductase [Candidatus Synoicihabitans palmerolidicus]|nr:SDR family oxidoreductase [Candidatus Synoicihabitans palmerolidicus]MCC5025752.1 SDR family oxidoreductase [Candidatus Synoicihabitans palmerolidicus]